MGKLEITTITSSFRQIHHYIDAVEYFTKLGVCSSHVLSVIICSAGLQLQFFTFLADSNWNFTLFAGHMQGHITHSD
jgi:hypothetical protein